VLVSRPVVFFPVVGSGCPVRMRRDLVEFGGSLVRIIWHAGLPSIFLCVKRIVPFCCSLPANAGNCQ
jgi:hypothetical protein